MSHVVWKKKHGMKRLQFKAITNKSFSLGFQSDLSLHVIFICCIWFRCVNWVWIGFHENSFSKSWQSNCFASYISCCRQNDIQINYMLKYVMVFHFEDENVLSIQLRKPCFSKECVAVLIGLYKKNGAVWWVGIDLHTINLFAAEILVRLFKNKGFWCCKITIGNLDI